MGSRGMRKCKARSGLCAGQAVSQAHARIRGAANRGQASSTLDKNRMREFRTYGSVRGVPSNGHPYRDPRPEPAARRRQLTGTPVRGLSVGMSRRGAMILASQTETPPQRGLIGVVIASRSLARPAPPHEADTGEAEAEE